MFKVKRLRKDIGRFTEIFVIVSKHGFGSFLEAKGFKKKEKAAVPAASNSNATRFCQLLEDLGPTFVKVGQLLSTRSDLLPPEFIAALSKLQDKVPPFPFRQAQAEIEVSLKRPLSEMFEEFDQKALASGSIAQVHRAKLHDGTEVIVKVRRPNIEQLIQADSAILQLSAQILEWTVAEASEYHATSFTEEFMRALTTELDFTNEALNLRLFRQYNKDRPGIYCPQYFADFSSDRILTMELVEGQRITDFPVNDSVTQTLVENLLELNFDHIFVDGVFHADPHPGNIIITPSQQIAFIDFGLIGKITRDNQDRLLAILIALSLRDADTLARLLVQLGRPLERVKISDFKAKIATLLEEYGGMAIGDIPTKNALADILQASSEFHIKMPKEFALLVKSSATIEGIVRLLHPGLNVYRKLGERAQNLLAGRFDPKNFKTLSLRLALQLATAAQDLPLQVNQVLLDLERGQTQITVKVREFENFGQRIESAAIIIYVGMISSACVVSGFYLLSLPDFADSHIRWIPFYIAGSLSMFSALWAAGGRRFPKLSVAWLRKRIN